jgi:hypothetical protein
MYLEDAGATNMAAGCSSRACFHHGAAEGSTAPLNSRVISMYLEDAGTTNMAAGFGAGRRVLGVGSGGGDGGEIWFSGSPSAALPDY